MGDKEFKQSKIEGFSKFNIQESWKEFYYPDLTMSKEKTIVIMESSSTGDRKVHIGELIQFLSYVASDSDFDEYYLVIFLCGNGKNPPAEDSEIRRLQFFYDKFPISREKRNKIKGIYVKKEVSKALALKFSEIKKYKGLSL